MTHRGWCPCGKVRFGVDGELARAMVEDVDLAAPTRVPVDGRGF